MDKDDLVLVKQVFAIISLGVGEALKNPTPARIRVTRTMIEGQLRVLSELGFGDEPSFEDLKEVAEGK